MAALFVSQSVVLCIAPSINSQSSAVSAELSLQMSGRYTEDTLPFNFLVSLMITSAHPMVGPVTGGTTVVIDVS